MIRRIIVIGLAVATSCLPARGENWPQWRGPDGNSVSAEKDLPFTWSARAGVAWKGTLPGTGVSTPAIWGPAIFVTSQEGESLLLSRVDKATGAVVWTKTVGKGTTPRKVAGRGEQKFNDLHNLASPSPVTNGRFVVAHFGNGLLAVYDFDGRQLWTKNLQSEHGKYTIWWGHANSPVIYKDLVINVCMQDSLADLAEHKDNPATSYVIAHDLMTGAQKWFAPRMTPSKGEESDSYATPALRRSGSELELVVMGGNELDAYDPATGRQVWRLPGLIGGRTVPSPTVMGDRIYVVRGMRGTAHAVRPKGLGKLNHESTDWDYRTSTPDSCTPVAYQDHLFWVTDDGIARCLDIRAGNSKWQTRLKGQFKASPVAGDGRVYFLNTTGTCYVFAATAKLEKLTENTLADETIASPAISDGRIYLRGKRTLYAIER